MKLKIQTTKLLDPSLIEMAAARTMSVPVCAAQIIEAAIVEFRSLRIRPSLVCFSKDNSDLDLIKARRRYVRLSEEQIQEALSLRDEGLTIRDVAKRFQKSPTAMGQLLKKHDRAVAAHVRIPGRRGSKRGKAISFSLPGSAQRKA
jgi:hypothetical protein